MASNVIFFGWSGSVRGREKLSAAHFQEFGMYLMGLKMGMLISSFESVMLTPHGGDLGGFFLIQGDPARLHQLVETEQWMAHVIRASHHLEGFGVVFGSAGDEIKAMMAQWTASAPS